MVSTDLPGRVLAVALAFLAGFVDAVGFLHLGGFFVSFMSGNSTRLAVGIAQHHAEAAIAGALIFSFLVGVILGSLIGHGAAGRRRSIVLAFVAALLTAAAGLTQFGSVPSGIGIVALAMGTMNAVFERDDDIPFGVTYMTGALVKVGQRIALALRGGPRTEWLPFLLLWAGLVSGAVAGSAIYPLLGLDSLWLAASASFALAVAAARYGAWLFGPRKR